jgi:superfamily II DNA helicase RecQ
MTQAMRCVVTQQANSDQAASHHAIRFAHSSPKMELSNALVKIGDSSLRGKQSDAINAINRGVDVIYLFPNGVGKTLVYEVSALCSAAATLFVSPLIGLLHQLANRLGAHRVGVLKAYDGKVLRGGEGDIHIIYCTPEQTPPHTALRRYLTQNARRVDRLVVDEAQLVVGHVQVRAVSAACDCGSAVMVIGW